jgi:2-oxoisovalerate dehydrogenase E1 component alpha subunit
MAQSQIWKRAEGYGMPGRRFNGFDPIETYAAVKEAMDRARSGGGPTLVEGTCYRYLAHSTDDNDMTYRTREEVLERRRQDPVPAFEAVLVEHGIMNAEDVASMRKDVLRETNEATDAAEALPYPSPADLYTHVFEGAWQPWQS